MHSIEPARACLPMQTCSEAKHNMRHRLKCSCRSAWASGPACNPAQQGNACHMTDLGSTTCIRGHHAVLKMSSLPCSRELQPKRAYRANIQRTVCNIAECCTYTCLCFIASKLQTAQLLHWQMEFLRWHQTSRQLLTLSSRYPAAGAGTIPMTSSSRQEMA